MALINLHDTGDRTVEPPHQDGPGPDPFVELQRILGVLRRRYRLLLSGLALGVGVGVAYIATTPPSYTAETQILIDSKRNAEVGLQTTGIADLSIDTGAVDSQAEILKSRKVIEAVVADFASRGAVQFSNASSLLSRFRGLFRLSSWGTAAEKTDEELRSAQHEEAVDFLGSGLSIRRIGRTYVLSIGFTSTDPSQSSSIANAFARAYLDDQFDANYEITRRASEWLLNRIQELRQKSLETDLAVQKYRSEKNLITTGPGGTLVNEQQLAEINSQLIVARGETARTRARYERVVQIQQTRQMDAAVTEALGNPIIVDLRNKYLASSKSEAELSARLGPTHATVLRLRGEMAEYERQIFDELGRIAQSYRSDLDIAEARERSLQSALASQIGVSSGINQDMVALRELEREAGTYKNLYESMLQRYQETVQKQSFPVSEARILSIATPPRVPSAPRATLVLMVAMVLGGTFGAALVFLREFADRGFRTSRQVAEHLGLEFLGMLPRVSQRQLDKVPPADETSGLRTPTLMRYSHNVPLSGFTETLRGAKVAADIALGDKKPKVIGIISVLPNEGKSTMSKNYASLLAHLGARTLLIDGDMRNPNLTRDLCRESAGGLLEVLTEGANFHDYILAERETGLHFLPGRLDRRLTHTSELLSSRAMARLIAQAGTEYDYIVFDLPPLGPVVDVRAASKMFDGFIVMIEWGITARDVVASTLKRDPTIYSKCIGAILNKVDNKTLALYENYGSKEYYYGRYKSYYHERS